MRGRGKSERIERILSLVGLARRAGSAVPGTDAARRAVRAGEARLVLGAGDASSAQLEKVLGVARNRGVPYRITASRARLGAAVGRPSISAVAITNASFAEQILYQLSPEDVGER